MIHCDNDDKCPYGEWFHISCLKLKNVPCVKKWYCPQCRKELGITVLLVNHLPNNSGMMPTL